MGEGVKTSPHEVEQKSIKETFDEICPFFMAIGMTYDEFWNKDPYLAKTYLKSHEIKQRMKNEELWLQGYYNYIAFAYVSPILNPFAKKGTKPISYPSQPIPLTREEVEAKEQREKDNRKLALKQKLLASVKNKEVIKK